MAKEYKDFDASGEFEGAFIVDESQLRRLVDEIKGSLVKGGEVSFEVNFTNNVSYKTENLEDIIEEENRSPELIESIEARGSSGDYRTKEYRSVSVSLGVWSDKYIRFSISGGDRDWVYLTKSKLEERIGNMKQWYSFLWSSPLKILSYIAGFFALPIFLGFLVARIFTSSGLTEGLIYSLFLISILMLYLSGRVRNYLFPRFVFELGNQIRNHKKTKDLRKNLFWVVFLGLVISFIVNLLV